LGCLGVESSNEATVIAGCRFLATSTHGATP
jgi:hypothetical protein